MNRAHLQMFNDLFDFLHFLHFIWHIQSHESVTCFINKYIIEAHFSHSQTTFLALHKRNRFLLNAQVSLAILIYEYNKIFHKTFQYMNLSNRERKKNT